jgi:hypothetical protein
MSTTAERVNNAIVTLDWRAPAAPAGVKRAVTDLAAHWVAYWNSAQRRLAPPLAEMAKLERYAAWYTRAWALMPEALREELTHPRDLDAGVWSALEDQLVFMAEGNEAAAVAAGKAGAALAREVKGALPGVLAGVVVVGGVAALVLFALAKAKPRWL